MKLRRFVLGLAAMALAVLPAGSAWAATSNTDLSIDLTNAGLTISAPASASLSGASTVGTTITGALGSTTVTDSRGTLAGWSVTVQAAGNLVGSNPANVITMSVGSSTLTWATGVVTPNSGSDLSGVAVGGGGNVNKDAAAPVLTGLALLSGGSYSYNPTVAFVVPPNVVADVYTVTLVQTVA